MEGGIGLAEVAEDDVFAFGRDTAGDGEDEIAAIAGDVGGDKIKWAEEFGVEFAAEEEGVSGVAGVEAMERDEGAFGGVEGVIDAGVVGCEVDGEVASGGEDVFEGLAGFDVEEVNFRLVRAALTDSVNEQAGVVGYAIEGDGGVGVAGDGGGVNEADVFTGSAGG